MEDLWEKRKAPRPLKFDDLPDAGIFHFILYTLLCLGLHHIIHLRLNLIFPQFGNWEG